MTSSQIVVLGSLFTVKAFGSAMFFAPMQFALRMYTTSACRPFAFSISYTVFNVAMFIAQLLINAAATHIAQRTSFRLIFPFGAWLFGSLRFFQVSVCLC